MEKIKCSRPECDKDAAYSVGLELRAKANTSPAVAMGALYVCEAHKDVELGDVIHDEGWESICKTFEARGYARPVWKLSNIKLSRLE
jgi:hypothetical protein